MMKRLVQTGLFCVTFISALQVVITRHEARRLFVELQTLESVRDELNEEWGRLQLEQRTWATDDRIESIAKTRFSMKTPGPSPVVLISK